MITSATDHPILSHIAVVVQRFLPYHVARLRRLRDRCEPLGYRLTAIEVAAQDRSYTAFPSSSADEKAHVCCCPGTSYHDLTAEEVHAAVLRALHVARPNIVFAPATPFPEGMAAVSYRKASDARVVMMDDAWELTDQRGVLVRVVKRLIHKNIDGVFIPAPSHKAYYRSLGFGTERIIYGVDVVDNDFFAEGADLARRHRSSDGTALKLPDQFFLFVGRFLNRKGVSTLLAAYRRYRTLAPGGWPLVLVGAGPDAEAVVGSAAEGDDVRVVGPQFGNALTRVYGLATVLVVPSISDPWGLVVNEGLAAGLPIIASTGVGAAQTLVHAGKNGWTVTAGNTEELACAMIAATMCSAHRLSQMGQISREIISAWSLDRFADGVFEAMRIPRAPHAGLLSSIAVRAWKGRVSTK